MPAEMSFARSGRVVAATCVLLLGTANSALAHPGHPGHDIADGLQHPLFGLDHLLAMVAVGLLAVRCGGRALWLMPATFLGSMILGGAAAFSGILLPGDEAGIQAAVVVLGLLIAATRVSLRVGLPLVALFAAFHGYAHAAEMSADASAASYAVGLLLATATLHVGGILAGYCLSLSANRVALRASGGLIAVAGMLLAVGIV